MSLSDLIANAMEVVAYAPDKKPASRLGKYIYYAFATFMLFAITGSAFLEFEALAEVGKVCIILSIAALLFSLMCTLIKLTLWLIKKYYKAV